MGKWLSKDPDAYLPDRPPMVQPYLERAREHAIRRDGPPYAADWRHVGPRWHVLGLFVVTWAAIAYGAAVLAGVAVSIDTAVLSLPILALARSDALRWNGAALNERRDRPSAAGRPTGAAPWLAIFALHLVVVLGMAAAVALATTDEGTQRVTVLASGFVAGAAGWLADRWWPRSEPSSNRA